MHYVLINCHLIIQRGSRARCLWASVESSAARTLRYRLWDPCRGTSISQIRSYAILLRVGVLQLIEGSHAAIVLVVIPLALGSAIRNQHVLRILPLLQHRFRGARPVFIELSLSEVHLFAHNLYLLISTIKCLILRSIHKSALDLRVLNVLRGLLHVRQVVLHVFFDLSPSRQPGIEQRHRQ